MQETNEKRMTFKEQILHLVDGMNEDDFNFEEEAAVFNWNFDETPELQYQLVIFGKGNRSVEEREDDSPLAFEFGDAPKEYLH